MKNRKIPKMSINEHLGYFVLCNNIKYLVNLAGIVFGAMKLVDKLRKNVIIIYNFVYIKGVL